MAESIARLEPYNEGDDIEEYFERMELFFEVHKIALGKKVAHFLSNIGPKTYTRPSNSHALGMILTILA